MTIEMSYKNQLLRIIVLVLIGFLGWLIAVSDVRSVAAKNYPIAQMNPANLNLGKQLYLENCSECHLPLPPQVLPTNSWQDILNNTRNHYGESLPATNNLTTQLIWNYLRFSSRPALEGERTPQYITNSRYFKALHPQIDLPKPSNHQSCSLCHPTAAQLDYRTLTDDWK